MADPLLRRGPGGYVRLASRLVFGRRCLGKDLPVKRLLRAIAVSGVLSVLLAGCSGDEPRPKMAPTTSASPTPSVPPSLDPTPTVVPTAPVLGPEETVRAWVEARNETLGSGLAASATLLSARDCKSCRDLLSPIESLYADGGRVETRGWIVEKLRKRPDFGRSGQLLAAVKFSPGKTFTTSSAKPTTFAAENHIMQFGVIRESDTWRISQIVFIP